MQQPKRQQQAGVVPTNNNNDDISDLLLIDPSSLDFTQVDMDLETFQQDPIVQSALSRGVDLRSYSQQIELDLNDAEVDFLQAVLNNSENLAEVYTQLTSCDTTLERMNDILSTFQLKLHDISHEIHTLQQLSITLSVELCNRKSVYNRLNAYTKNTYLPPDLVNVICSPAPGTAGPGQLTGVGGAPLSDGPVTPQLASYLPVLTNIILFHSLPQVRITQPAVDMVPVLHHVYSRAIIRSRNSLMGWINELKKPTVNIYVKQTRLLRFRACYDFLLLHCGSSFVDELTRASYDNNDGLNNNGLNNNNNNNGQQPGLIQQHSMPNPNGQLTTTSDSLQTNTMGGGVGQQQQQQPLPPSQQQLIQSTDPNNHVSVVTMTSIESYLKQLGDLSQEVRNFYISVMSFVYFQHFKTYTSATLKLQQTPNQTPDDLIGGEHVKAEQLQYQSGIDPHNTTQNAPSKGGWFKFSWGGGSGTTPDKKEGEKPIITPSFFYTPQLYFRPNEFESISQLLVNHNKMIPTQQRNLANQFNTVLTNNTSIPFELYNIISTLSFSQTTMSLSTLPSIRAMAMGQKDVVLALQLDNIVLPTAINQTQGQIAAGQPTYISINTSLLPPSALPAQPNHNAMGANNNNSPDQEKVLSESGSEMKSPQVAPLPVGTLAASTVSKLPFERLFRSALHLLIDTCITEYTFIHQFFGVSTSLIESQTTQTNQPKQQQQQQKNVDPATQSTIKKSSTSPTSSSSTTITNSSHNSNEPGNYNPYIAHIYDAIFDQQAEEEIEYTNLQQLLRTVRSNNNESGDNDDEDNIYGSVPKTTPEDEPSQDLIRNLLSQCQDRVSTLSSALLPFRVQQGFTQFSAVFQRIFQYFIDVLDQYTSQCHDIASLLILLQIVYIYEYKTSSYHVVSSVSLFLTKLVQLLIKRIIDLLDQQCSSIRYVTQHFSQDLDWFQEYRQQPAKNSTQDPKAPTILARLRGYIAQIIFITYKYTEFISSVRKFEQFYLSLTRGALDQQQLANPIEQLNDLADNSFSALPNMILELQPYILQLNREFEFLMDSSRDLVAQVSLCHSAQTEGSNSHSTLDPQTHNVITVDNSKANTNILVNMFNVQVNHLILSLIVTRQQNMITITPPLFTPSTTSHSDVHPSQLYQQVLPQPSLLLIPEFKHHKKGFLTSLESLSDAVLRKFFSPMLDFVHSSEGYLDTIEKPQQTSSSKSSHDEEDPNNKTNQAIVAFAKYFLQLNDNDGAGFDLIAKQFFVTQQQWKDSLLALLLESEALCWNTDTSKMAFTQVSIAMSMLNDTKRSNKPSPSSSSPTNNSSNNNNNYNQTNSSQQKGLKINNAHYNHLLQLFGGETNQDAAVAELLQIDFGHEDVGSLIPTTIIKRFLMFFVRYTDVLKRSFELFKKQSISTILQNNSVDVGRLGLVKQKLQEYTRRTATIHSLLAEIKKYNKNSGASNGFEDRQ